MLPQGDPLVEGERRVQRSHGEEQQQFLLGPEAQPAAGPGLGAAAFRAGTVLLRHRSSRKVPSAPNAGPSVLRPPPQPAFSPQSRTCRDLPRARRPLRLLVALARTALRHQPGLLGAAASFTWPQSLGPGAGRAGRGALGGAAHVESSAQSLRARDFWASSPHTGWFDGRFVLPGYK